MEPLEANPKRQAVNSLKGYIYQIWHSVYAWLNLKENEILYLEGAEDIDVLTTDKAETIQVKDIKESGTVTLHSRDILDAINHFWEHQSNNWDREIRFRFLTTAEKGKEKSENFGSVKGLDYWDNCKRDGTDIEPIKDFLISQDSLLEDLKEFVKKSDNDSIRNKLIRQIDWDTGNQPKEFIEELINKLVVTYGIRFHIQPSESVKVVSHLLKHVSDTVCQKDNRKLDYVDFTILFENITTERTSKQELAVLRALATQFQSDGLFPSSKTGDNVISSFDIAASHLSPSRLLSKAVYREELVNGMLDRLVGNRVLILKGSSGMGKSTLAALIVHKGFNNFRWLDMRGAKASEIRDRFYSEAVLVSQFKGFVYIIDDLNFDSDMDAYENALLSLSYAVNSNNGLLIITTQGDVSERVRTILDLYTEAIASVPPMTIDEIKKLAILHGCSFDKGFDNAWGYIIFAQTSGHPQLVNAKIRKLTRSGWPNPTQDDLIKSEDFETVRKDIRKRLFSELSYEDARILLYRLSIFRHPFRRGHALLMGKHIRTPGEAFDMLVGPWIEQISDDYYRVSPLLYDAANEMWSPNEVKELHREAAISLLSVKSLTTIEASNILLHGIIGGAEKEILAIVVSLLSDNKEVLPKIANELIWLTFLALEASQKIYPQNSYLNVVLRHLQFRIAEATNPNGTAIAVANAWCRDIEELDDERMKRGMRLLFLMETIIRFDLPLPPKEAILRIIETMNLMGEVDSQLETKLSEHIDSESPLSYLILFAIVRCKSSSALYEFIATIDAQGEEVKQSLLVLLRREEDWAKFLISGVYFHEHDLPSTNWESCIAALEFAIEKAQTWGIAALVAEAYHMISVIQDEHLHDTEAALDTLRDGEKTINEAHPVIADGRAMILYRQKKYDEALKIWEDILPKWHTTFDTYPLHSYRRAEICAAQLGNWGKASDLALAGESLAIKTAQSVMAIGFHADHAFALWKSGDRAAAINAFASVIDSFQNLPDPQNDLRSYALQKLVGHAISWLSLDIGLTQKEDHAEPPAGCFSNDEIDERIKEYPIVSPAFLWLTLGKIECEIGGSSVIYKRMTQDYKDAELPSVRFFLGLLSIKHALRNHKFEYLVEEFEGFSRAHEALNQISKGEPNYLSKGHISAQLKNPHTFSDQLIYLLLSAIMLMKADKKDITDMLKLWDREIERFSFSTDNINRWLKFVEEHIEKEPLSLASILMNEKMPYEDRILSALFISENKDVRPVERFYSDLMLLYFVKGMAWKNEIEGVFESLVTKGWRYIAANQAFDLKNPMIYVPNILIACDDSTRGVNKAARILVAARDSINISVSSDTLTELIRLANG